MEKRKALGRGLSALIPVPSVRRDLFDCAIEEIHPSRENPRQLYDAARLQGLADSIRQQGVVQPLVVRQRPEPDGGAAAIERAAARVATRQLSVRQTEELVRRERQGAARPRARPTPSASVRDLETRLERALGTKVRLAQKSAQAGTVEIDYHSL